MRDAEDAKRQVLDLVGSQRSYDNRSSNRSDGNRGSSQFDGNRGSNRSDGNRDYNSRRNERSHFDEPKRSTDNHNHPSTNNVSQQQNNDNAEPMEYEMIDWQAAARESVSVCRKCLHRIGITAIIIS